MKKVPLTYPLPAVQWVQLPNGLWYSRPWSPEEKAKAEAAKKASWEDDEVPF